MEVCIDSQWARVCGNGWDDNDAAVVCHQLGYGRAGKRYYTAIVVALFNLLVQANFL